MAGWSVDWLLLVSYEDSSLHCNNYTAWNCRMAFELWTGKEEKERHHGLFKVDCVWNVMAHAQKPDFVFRRKGRVHLNRRGCQFSWLLAAEMCASAVVMLDTPCSEVVWSALDTHSIRQFPLHFPSRASPCAITFQLESATPKLVGTNFRKPRSTSISSETKVEHGTSPL